MTRTPHPIPLVRTLAAAALCLPLCARTALAIDGAGITAGSSYYQGVVGSSSTSALESSATGLPDSLHIVDSTATLEYSASEGAGGVQWTARIRGFSREHERVAAVYHMMLILPLPADSQGRIVARSQQFAIGPREGTTQASVPLIYGGEKVVLKRSHSLERTLLPGLLGSRSDKLPSLAGTGYDYSVWDTLVRYDPDHGDRVQAFVDFRYTTGSGVASPDPADERFKAYVVTWIPSLDPSTPPFAVRLDVRPPD